MGRFLAFWKAVLIGSVVGGGPFLPFTFYLAFYRKADQPELSFADMVQALQFALLPLAFAFVIVFSTSVLIGLPLTHLFRRTGVTAPAPYLISGGLVGLVIPIIVPWLMGWSDMAWMDILGAPSGAATAYVWWRATRARAGGVSLPS